MLNSIYKYGRVVTSALFGLAFVFAFSPMAANATDDVVFFRLHVFDDAGDGSRPTGPLLAGRRLVGVTTGTVFGIGERRE